MNVCQSLICFFFLTLQDGNIGLINAEIIESTGTEGGNITVRCSFTFSGKRRIFCKDKCKDGDILIDTEEDTAQRGRYSIEYKNSIFSKTVLYVSIIKLNKSDSGQYWCGLERSFSFSSSYQEIEIRVTDALQDGNIGLINAENLQRTGTEGGDITVGCSFTFSGYRRIFCKDECKDGDILIDTEEDTAQRGRYGIEYKNSIMSATVLYVSITKLNKSDSGRYRCGLVRSLFPSSYQEIEIRVTDAPTSPLRPSSPSVPSASTLMTSQSLSSTPSSASPEASEQPRQKHTTPAASAAHAQRALLYAGLTLVLFFIMLSVALLIFCRMRARKPKEPPVETEYSNVTKANRVYEEIREDRQSTSPPVEVSTVYTYAKYTKPDGVETTEEYSLVTAPTSQKKTEDDRSDLTYSELHVPNGTADNVVYSVPRVEASSAGSHAQDASPPLYSTVTLHQL
ncbi:hypothetical protein PFLUV_G00053090 [Perca fluviatilis]|uniref:Immunoglobulin domain-containing protein n=1 Tax=Perca fluviatilis TaxID=8168 RepID=A0A6A5FC57_PERFL|nr:uncharacterized protein LOC120558791 isoform X3 [Perca fluviatilis]KAF1389958.1 hypothetical protein PFLUV_G00053090 [Perca fluviatilis]